MLTISQHLPKNGIVIHGTALAWQHQGVLLLGPSGCGKSDLALRLMDKGAMLIADDQVIISSAPQGLYLSCPPELQGKIEIFGAGLFDSLTFCTAAPLYQIFSHQNNPLERLPQPSILNVLEHPIPLTFFDFLWPSTPEKISFLLKLHKQSLTS